MEMSDDDMEDAPESKDSDDSGIHRSWLTVYKQKIKTILKAVQRYSLIVLKRLLCTNRI